jgi:HAD superfamily hydrolase (TIGR01509 family)
VFEEASHRPVDAVVFDLDGLLLESEQEWSAAKRQLTTEHGGTWTEAAETEMLGMSSREWSRYMHDELGVPLDPDEISAEVVRILERRYREHLPLLPGADEAVRRIGGRWPLGLASSSNREIIDLVLELTGWADLFRVTVSSAEVERGKPAPDVYLEAVRRLSSPPDRCVAVEDSDAGIGSARAAGLAVVAIPNRAYPPDPDVLEQADVVLASLAELDEAAVARAAAARSRRDT